MIDASIVLFFLNRIELHFPKATDHCPFPIRRCPLSIFPFSAVTTTRLSKTKNRKQKLGKWKNWPTDQEGRVSKKEEDLCLGRKMEGKPEAKGQPRLQPFLGGKNRGQWSVENAAWKIVEETHIKIDKNLTRVDEMTTCSSRLQVLQDHILKR